MALIEVDQGTLNIIYNTALTLQLAADEDLKAAQARNELAQLQLAEGKAIIAGYGRKP